jgi:ribosome-binding factor A
MLRVGEQVIASCVADILSARRSGSIRRSYRKDRHLGYRMKCAMSPDLQDRDRLRFARLASADDDGRRSMRSTDHAKFIRGRLGAALRQMKYMPELRFRDDTSFDNFSQTRSTALLKSSGGRPRSWTFKRQERRTELKR